MNTTNITHKFARIAWREVDHADSSDPEDRAIALMAGYIGDGVETKSEYLARGEDFLNFFDEEADAQEALLEEEIDRAMDDEAQVARLEAVRSALLDLQEEAKRVDPVLFIKILAEDWDERHEEEEAASN